VGSLQAPMDLSNAGAFFLSATQRGRE
jgi:hypothetical protein